MTDISDAYEASYTIMLNLNKTWIEKQGDFFVESPIILLAAIIWYLKIYKNGIYCSFPHAVELLNKPYSDLFTILTWRITSPLSWMLGKVGRRISSKAR